jgi:NAD(P) transhydrogenase subunit alpha
MRIGVPKESVEGEKRVALIPATVESLAAEQLAVTIESGAGEAAGHPDFEYEDAGASIGSADDAWAADIVLRVATPTTEEIRSPRGRRPGRWQRRG